MVGGRSVGVLPLGVALALGLEMLLFLTGVDLRRVPDAVGGGGAARRVLALVTMLVVPVRGGWGRAVAWTVAAALVCVTVWLLVALGDLWTWFPLLGFLLAVVGLLVVVGAVLVALVALVRRRRRLVEPAAAAG